MEKYNQISEEIKKFQNSEEYKDINKHEKELRKIEKKYCKTKEDIDIFDNVVWDLLFSHD
jgi:chromosome segregation ATPase